MKHVDSRKNAPNSTALTPTLEKVSFFINSGPSNPLEAFMKNMMMSKGANMFNKQKPQKKRPNQQDAKEDEQQEQ